MRRALTGAAAAALLGAAWLLVTALSAHAQGSFLPAGPVPTVNGFPVNFADGEIPVELNGNPLTYTLLAPPRPADSLKVYVNGLRQVLGQNADFEVSGNTITFLGAGYAALLTDPTTTLVADYRY